MPFATMTSIRETFVCYSREACAFLAARRPLPRDRFNRLAYLVVTDGTLAFPRPTPALRVMRMLRSVSTLSVGRQRTQEAGTGTGRLLGCRV
jgi:hypothetical protein